MNTLSNTGARDVGALVAALFGVVLVGMFALALASQDGATDASESGAPHLTVPALSQGARYPQTNDEFAPGPFAPTATPPPAAAHPAACQGEGLMDIANRTVLNDELEPPERYCDYLAYPAGSVDDTRSLDPQGEGRLDSSQRR